MIQNKFKESDVDWIGKIPEHWKVVKVKDAFFRKNAKAKNPNPVILTLSRESVKIRDISNNDGQIAEDYSNYNPVSIDDILLNPMDLISGDNCNISRVEGVISPAYINLRYKKGVNPEYYNLFFKYMYWSKVMFAHGKGVSFDNRWTLNYEILSNLKIPLPPKKEQNLIADFLLKKIETIYAIQKSISIEIKTLEDYKKSIITEAVTKGLDRDVPMKDSGIEWIGEIPDHWQIKKLKYIADTICKGISPSYTEEELVPVINQASFSQGYLNKDFQYCNDDANSDAKLNYGDVLLATTGGGVLGKSFYFEEEGDYLASTDVAFIRTNNLNLSKFIYYIFSVNYDLFNGEFAKGSTNQTHLQMNLLSNMMLPLPSNSEIIKIVEYLDRLMINIENIINQKQVQIQSLEEYKKSLIYEYVTGKKEVGRG